MACLRSVSSSDNETLQVVPYTIAQLLVESCYGDREKSTAAPDIQCPNRDDFNAMISQRARDADYQAAIREIAEREVIRDQLVYFNNTMNQ